MQDRVRKVLSNILNEFKNGDIPEAIAYTSFPIPKIPSSYWSFLNIVLMYISGTIDARGFRQWEEVGRKVKKGSKAIYILVPMFKKKKDNEDRINCLDDKSTKNSNDLVDDELTPSGFMPKPVFKVEDTEGDVLEYEKRELPDLPLLDKAEEWGITVKMTMGNLSYNGVYSSKKKEIRLATSEEKTFFHELSHAAHDRLLGGLKNGQDPMEEIVAELSAQSLCRIVGRSMDSYIGNTYDYIEHYSKKLGISPYSACLKVLYDVEKVLKLILDDSVVYVEDNEVMMF